MSIHLLIHTLLVVGVVLILLWCRKWFFPTEDATEHFTQEQDEINKFHYQLVADPPVATSTTGKQGIALNPGLFQPTAPSTVPLTFGDLDKVVEMSGIFGPLFKDNALSKFFFQQKDTIKESDATCQMAGHPSKVGTNQGRIGLEEGCGWWFVEDPTVPSTAAFGTPDGPDQSAAQGRLLDQHPGGVWMWDMAEAEKLEDMKRCRMIRTCGFIQDENLGVKCAYCPDLGYAVPVEGSTQPPKPKYPQEAAATCGEDVLVTDPQKCPAPKFVPRLVGIDYEYDLNGNVVDSVDTNARLAYEKGGVVLKDVCEPVNGTGFVSRDCLKSMAASAGCVEGGAMMRLLDSGPRAINEVDRVALDVLEKKGALVIQRAFWNAAVRREEAANIFNKLYTLSMAPTSKENMIVKDAAAWMQRGGDFDVCQYKETDENTAESPFRIECIQREFRKVGCQTTGAAYPQHPSQYFTQSMATIKTQFRDLYDAMQPKNAESVQAQDDAVRKCLGIQVTRESDEAILEAQPTLCVQRGVLYEVFEIPADAETPRVFLGSTMNTRGWDVETNGLRELLGRVRVGARGMYVARTTVLGAEETMMELLAESASSPAAQIHVLADNNVVSSKQVGRGVMWETRIPAKTPVEVKVVFTERDPRDATNKIPELLGPTVGTRGMLQRVYLPYESWRPAVDLGVDPKSTKWMDKSGLFGMNVSAQDIQTITEGGRKGVRITAAPLVTTMDVGIRHDTLGTITCMVFPTSLTDQVTVFRLSDGVENSMTFISLQLLERRPVFTMYQGRNGMVALRGTKLLENTDLNTWVHLAVTVGGDSNGTRLEDVKMFMNGVDITPRRVLGGAALGDIQQRGQLKKDIAYTQVSLGSRGFLGALTWFHMYKVPLDADGLKRDIDYDKVKAGASAPSTV